MPLLEVEGLAITAGGARVLEGLSFRMGHATRLALVGESGAGKTLVALAIAGLLPETARREGVIRLDGTAQPLDETAQVGWRGKRIAMIADASTTALNPLMTAAAQVAEAVGGSGAEREKRTAALLADVGLEPAHGRCYPGALTAGQRQQVLVAMALAAEPAVLIADEPVAALDPPAQRLVLDLIKKNCDSRNMALLFISHDLKAVAALCNEMMVLQGGKAIESGPITEVLRRPQQDYTKELVAAGKHRARTLMRSPIGTDLLAVNDVTRVFEAPLLRFGRPGPRPALDSVSFVLRRSECLAVVGPAGSGKTTLARIIAGLDRASSGTLEMEHHTYRGTDLPRVLRRQITMVFEDARASFDPRLTVGASVTEPLRLEPQLILEEQADRLVEVVRAAGLSPDVLTRYPASFSDGDMLRLAFARALIAKPRLVIFDEPVAALDVSLRGEMLMLLNRLRADFGLTSLVMSRDLDTVRSIADRVLVLEQGTIVETGKPADLIEAPQQPLTRALVEARLPDVADAVRLPPEAVE
jgi:peptide/nickel transport system ATP-binding protein